MVDIIGDAIKNAAGAVKGTFDATGIRGAVDAIVQRPVETVTGVVAGLADANLSEEEKQRRAATRAIVSAPAKSDIVKDMSGVVGGIINMVKPSSAPSGTPNAEGVSWVRSSEDISNAKTPQYGKIGIGIVDTIGGAIGGIIAASKGGSGNTFEYDNQEPPTTPQGYTPVITGSDEVFRQANINTDPPKPYSNEKVDAFKATYTETKSNRPGYIAVGDLGLDRKTWSLIADGDTPLIAVTKRLDEETNPRTKRYLQWAQGALLGNKVSNASEYHAWAMSTGKPTAINPYMNQGDMALAILQGNEQEGKLQIAGSNPGVNEIFAELPGEGIGLGTLSYGASGKAGDSYNKKIPSLLPAITKMESKAGDVGIYGSLRSDGNYDEWNKASLKSTPVYQNLYDQNNNIIGTKLVDTRPGTGKPRNVKYISPSRVTIGEEYTQEFAALPPLTIAAFGSKRKMHTPKRKPTVLSQNHKSDMSMNDILYGNIKPPIKTIKTHKADGDKLMNDILYGDFKKSKPKQISKKPKSQGKGGGEALMNEILHGKKQTSKKSDKKSSKKKFNYNDCGI